MEQRPTLTGDTLDRLADVARLPLDEERAAVTGPALDTIYRLVDGLDDLALGETPPATAFDARWD